MQPGIHWVVLLCTVVKMMSSSCYMTHPFARTHAHADNYWRPAQVTKIISLKCTRNRKHVDFITFECFDKWKD